MSVAGPQRAAGGARTTCIPNRSRNAKQLRLFFSGRTLPVRVWVISSRTTVGEQEGGNQASDNIPGTLGVRRKPLLCLLFPP